MDKYKIEITRVADRDLGDNFEHVASQLFVPDTAAKLVSRLYDAISSLSESPLRYPLSRDNFLAKQGFRLLLVDNYIVFYVIDEPGKRVIVHRVVYARRNYRSLFVDGGGL